MSGFCQNSLSGVCLSGFCLSRFCPVSGFCHDFSEKVCPVSVCPAGRTRTRQRCPDFHCRCPLNSDLNKETVIEKEKFDERVIDSAFEKIIESKTEDLETHFVYAGFHYTDSKLKSLILKVMKKYNFKMVMVTVLFIERNRLITKERMENYFEEKDRHSINDDLESLFQDLQLGSKPDYFVSTDFLPKLTEEELKLAEWKDYDFMQTFYSKMDADVTKAEMMLSESDSKFVHCYGWRETFTIENLKRKISSLFSKNFNKKLIETKNI